MPSADQVPTKTSHSRMLWYKPHVGSGDCLANGICDDYQVFWRSVLIGRIMKTTGYPTRDAQWSWVISLPRESGDCGTGDNLADCEAKLGRALARILARVTKDDRAQRG